MGAPVGSLALLLALCLVPVGVALFLMRRRFGEAWSRFWPAFGLGVFSITLLIVAAVAWATSVAKRETIACEAAEVAATYDCANNGLFVVLIGIFGLGTLLLFLVSALGLQALRRRQTSVEPQG